MTDESASSHCTTRQPVLYSSHLSRSTSLRDPVGAAPFYLYFRLHGRQRDELSTGSTWRLGRDGGGSRNHRGERRVADSRQFSAFFASLGNGQRQCPAHYARNGRP